MSTGVGPFFSIKGKILADVIPISNAEKYGDKLTSTVSHSDLYDRVLKCGEYMLYPRGRIVWDTVINECIVYIDKCLDEPSIIDEIRRIFDLTNFRVEHDEHYICPKCKPGSFIHLR